MSESLPSGRLLRSLFASLLSFALSSKMYSKIVTEKSLAGAKFIAWIKIYVKIDTFEESVVLLNCKLWLSVQRESDYLLSCTN